MNSESTTSLIYKPLVGPGRIRLVILLPSENEAAQIECRLIHGWIKSPLSHEALSYCWGNEVASHSILINGSEFMVRENLLGALRRLRLAKTTRLIWIDAICINQADIDERNSQVSQMRLIYSNAERVVIWLGEDLDGAEVAMQFIPDLITLLETNSLKNREEKSLKLLTGYQCVALLAMLGRLFNRPWWRRVWIVQEVSTARVPPLVYCGSQTFEWGLLELFLKVIHKSRVYDLLLQPNNLPNSEQAAAALHVLKWTIEPITALVLIRNDVAKITTRRRLSELIWLTRAFDASDLRDKIYALIGLTNPPFHLSIDYNRGVDCVNLSATIQMLREDKDLRSLGWMNVVEEESAENQPPSWMNHFTKDKELLSIISTRISLAKGTKFYSADGNEDSVFGDSFLFNDNERVLIVEGIRFDEVKVLGNDPFARPTNEEKTLKSVFLQWKQSAELDGSQSTGDKIVRNSNFWRTLLLDRSFIEICNEKVSEPTALRRLGDDTSSFCPTNALEEERIITALDEITPYPLRRFFISANGRMGLAPSKARAGDQICVLFGAEVPFIFRPLENANYQLIGECYLHGVMDGEIVDDQRQGKYHKEDFYLK